ncbi:MAG: hypothetical protein H7842_10565 [Gammaproteobacteria bacterium SHHR-1]|uniref:hypothetical protein n=1 Tax=Magnetovirga frankeli TaxID=947516 RepID=UPI003282F1F8
MFDDNLFDEWLDAQSRQIFTRLTAGEALRPEEMIILVLKAQTNHFAHLDQDLRQEMIQLRTDMDKRFEQVDKRFEQVEKRFEQVDKRFEQVDKRFDEIIRRMDRFMFWSLGITVAAAVFVVNYLK